MVDARQAGPLMGVRRVADPEQVARAAADAIGDALRSAVAQRNVFTIALAGGDTPRRCYEQLAGRRELAWPRVEFFFGDERPVPPDHPDSNFAMADRALLRPLAIDPRRIHRIEADRSDLDSAAHDYEDALARFPILDLVLLGMGADGHTASLFPHTAALSETRRSVVANEVPQLGTRRITITFPLIERARAVLVLVTGAAKADALAQVLAGPLDPQRLPSQRLRDLPNVEWLVDTEAASRS
jgi:6-phosphogluconolactonase